MLISRDYLAANRELHARGHYGVSGAKWAEPVADLARMCEARTVLDYGSGQGRLRQALCMMHAEAIEYDDDGVPRVVPGLPFEVLEYDPAIPGKETKPSVADIAACTDVLEHIEPQCLGAVLDDLRSIARKAVFLVVATRPAKKVLADGRNAHLIVQPAHWWLPKLMQRWRMRQFTDFGSEFLFVGTPA